MVEKEKERYFKNFILELEKKNELQSKINQLKVEALQAQFNPHFIFNSLNSIQYLVMSNQTDEASKYIDKFSKLFRQILDASRNEYITLEKELEIYYFYVQIEQERLHQQFECIFDIQEDILLDNIFIPPFLFQPFLENSIWHGLQPSLEKDKILYVKVYQLDIQQIYIDIIDNGIGIENSKKHKNITMKHQSHGLSIIQDRIDAFNNSRSSKISLEIKSPYPDNSSTGTLIRICIQSNKTTV